MLSASNRWMDAALQRTPHDPSISQSMALLVETGLMLARETSCDRIVEAALSAGRQLCNAEWGAFFYTELSAEGAPCPLFKLTGTVAADPGRFPFATLDHHLTQTLFGTGTVRCADISSDAHFGPGTPFAPLTSGPYAIRSYFAVPIHSASGELFGGILYGHPEPHIFTAVCEPIVETLAAQAAIAIDNTRLHEHLSRQANEAAEARHLQRQTAERLSQVFEVTTDAVHLIDRNWLTTYMNPRAAAIVAGGRDLVGLNVWEAFPEAVGTSFQTQLEIAMRGVKAVFTEFYPPLGVWLRVQAFPTDEGVAVFFQDITEERRVAREKEETDRRLRLALDSGQLGTWTWDRATDLLDLDQRAAELFFTEPHIPVSRSLLRDRVVLEDDRPVTYYNLQTSMASGGLYQAEYRIQSPEGVFTWLSAQGLPLFADGSTEVTGMVGTVQDITSRKTQENALRQSEKLAATGRLAATIAHEINNPLEAITNLIYLVKTDPAVPAPAQLLLETADQELARVSQIAQQTLGFYRDTTRPVDIDIAALLKTVLALFERKLKHQRVDFRFDLGPDLHVFALQGELRQVFSNLVVNAIDASSGGRITVRARRRTVNGVPGVTVLVADQGSGISSAARERLFSPFFTTKASVGTGLGLWVTRGIVEKHGGSIRFRSRSTPPTGTVFRVFLRARMEPA